MSRQKPPWWRAFDKVERAVGEPLEEVVASRPYVDAMLTGMKAQRKVLGAVGRAASGAVEKVLHAVQIPTRSDVRRLNNQIVELATELRQLSADRDSAARAVKGRGATTGSTPDEPKQGDGDGE